MVEAASSPMGGGGGGGGGGAALQDIAKVGTHPSVMLAYLHSCCSGVNKGN